jgi:hypothetical protein
LRCDWNEPPNPIRYEPDQESILVSRSTGEP